MTKEKTFSVVVKPNSSENEIVCFNESKNAYVIRIRAPAEKDKANKELVRFLSKELKRKVSILKGLRSKEKLIKTETS